MIVKISLIIIFGLITLLLVFLTYRDFKSRRSQSFQDFLNGTLPKSELNGFYKGSVTNFKTSWQGKKFDSSSSTGINIILEADKKVERYPFKTYKGKGISDDLEVLKIDYNISENPLYFRPILDEVVQTGENKFLGKLQLRLLPGLHFTLGYFHLEETD